MFRFRYFLVPVYSASIMVMIYNLPKSFFFQLSYWLCTGAVLVSQKLLEFRYFIIPFLIFSLFSTQKPNGASILYHVTVSGFMFYLFATKEIIWADEENIQRMFWWFFTCRPLFSWNFCAIFNASYLFDAVFLEPAKKKRRLFVFLNFIIFQIWADIPGFIPN